MSLLAFGCARTYAQEEETARALTERDAKEGVVRELQDQVRRDVFEYAQGLRLEYFGSDATRGRSREVDWGMRSSLQRWVQPSEYVVFRVNHWLPSSVSERQVFLR